MSDVPCAFASCGLPRRLHGAPDGSTPTLSDHWWQSRSKIVTTKGATIDVTGTWFAQEVQAELRAGNRVHLRPEPWMEARIDRLRAAVDQRRDQRYPYITDHSAAIRELFDRLAVHANCTPSCCCQLPVLPVQP